MSNNITVDETLMFTFPDEWKHSIYENSQTRTGLQKKINSIRCVDLLLFNKPGSILYIIEVKDYDSAAQQKMTEMVHDLPKVLSEKFIDTIAGLTCAKMCGDDELKDFYRALLDSSIKKRLVCFVDLGKHRNDKRGNGQKLISDLQQRMKTVLKPVCCNKRIVCDTITVPESYGWTVTRVGQ